MDKLLRKKAKIEKRIATYKERLLAVERKIAAASVKKDSEDGA